MQLCSEWCTLTVVFRIVNCGSRVWIYMYMVWSFNIISASGLALTVSSHVYITHWGRVTHICVSKLSINGSDNVLWPCWHQAVIWTNYGILLIRKVGTYLSENLSEIHTFSFAKMHLKMLSAKWLILSRPQYVNDRLLYSYSMFLFNSISRNDIGLVLIL